MDIYFEYIGKYSSRETKIPIIWNEEENLAYVKDVSGNREMKDFLRNEMIEFPDSLDIILGEVFKYSGAILQKHIDTLAQWIEDINNCRPSNLPG